jgi:hypothetical protein
MRVRGDRSGEHFHCDEVFAPDHVQRGTLPRGSNCSVGIAAPTRQASISNRVTLDSPFC